MLQLPMPFRKRVKTRYTRARRPRCFRPHCKLLEDRCLLSITLTPSGPSVPLVGSPVVWTATASGDGTTPVYQFSVAPSGGATQMVQDFSPSNTFTWNPMQEGTYQIQVSVKQSYSATTVDTGSASYTAKSRVLGPSPLISPMSNPLVALFSAPPSSGTSMYVQFSPLGPNLSWTDTSPLPVVPGKSTNFIVAGMLPDTTYLMRDVLNNGAVSTPLAFRTGNLPSNLAFPTFTVPQPPAPGTDLSQDMILHFGIGAVGRPVNLVATDLAGNVDWYYDAEANNFSNNYATTILPGGTLFVLGGTQVAAAGGFDTLRQIDLAGDTLRETNINAVSAELAALGQPSITDFDHDAVRLPNGDTAVIALTQKVINVNGTPTTYNGTMIVVLNQNFQVSWAWDAFNYPNNLPTSRLGTNGEPASDWLHTNSVAWSPTDGNLIVSMRAQDWVIKIDYANGTGDGHIIWTLGQGGNFTLIAPPGVQSPWFSHQHDVTYVDDSTILVFDDGNTRHLTDPNADSRGQEYILNEKTMTATLVVNADMGNFSAALGAAQLLPNGNLDFTSGFLGTAPNNYGQSIEVLPNGTKTYVQQMAGSNLVEYRSYFMNNLYGTPANIYNPGFEYPILGSGESAYQYDPTSTAWSFVGQAGVTGNGSGFTSGNPDAPQASQVAFLQRAGTISQVVDFTAAGSYQISLSAAQRANDGTSDEEFQVLVDGTVVGTITPASTNYASYTTGAFNVTAGSHTISFVGVDPSGNDYTAFLDQVNVENVSQNELADPSFESPIQGSGNSAYQYDPTATPWTFNGQAGVSGNGSGFTSGNPNAPQGNQVAFLQRAGTISQIVNFGSAGSYVISLGAAQRENYLPGNDEEFEVLVDGKVVDTLTPSGTSYSTYTTAPFNVTAGSHTISFVGIDPGGIDYTAFIDDVSIVNVSTAAFSQPGFESPSQGSGESAYDYDPTGTAWTFSGQAGVAGNGSGFTSGNPNAPEGSQVAFLQMAGTMSQVVNFAAPGSYLISLSAAQRQNYLPGNNEEFEVLVDGAVVGTITPSSTNYSTYATASFSVLAGNHTISFVGVDPSGNDYTAFVDNVNIVDVSSNGFTDPSFQNPPQGLGESAYQYDPTVTAWTFKGQAGVSGNGSGFTSGNPNAPLGSQVAFIQRAGSISQVVPLASTGSYQISLSAAQRENYLTGNAEEFEVLVDGTLVATITPSSTNYSTYTTAAFNLRAGSHTISFVGIDPSGIDYTAFLGNVSLVQIG